MFLTDDRGVYRIYGLPPGKYFVSAGGARMLFFFGDRKSTSTYYPGVTDRARAKPVEVTAGGETTGIDIRVTPSAKGYQASGRVIDGDTGKPLPNAMVLFMPAGEKDDTFFTNFPGGVSSTGPKGEFHLDNIPSGVYTATAQFVERESEYYSEMASFEIKSADATGIEIKLRRGSSISGFVIVEDTTDPEILARLPQVVLTANSTAGEDSSPGLEFSGPGRGKILPDGSFRVWGLRPGTVRIHAGGLPGLKLARVERDGLNQKDGIELKAGEQISGVRLVFATASGVIRGRVVIEGGPLPVGTALIVSVENAGDDDSNNDGVAVGDATGNFTIENLLPGTYEVRVRAMREGQPTGLPEAKQTVNVVKDVPAEVTLVLNLKPKND
jgi:hypothetical protein